MDMQFTIEWPCARNLPEAETILKGDMEWCLMQVRYRQNLRRLDGYGAWLIRRDSDGIVIAQSTQLHVDVNELDAAAAEVKVYITNLRKGNCT